VKYKFLDFLSGVIDESNILVGTDPINKAVYFEPAHPYSLTNDLSVKSGGYFNGNYHDWSEKQDLSKRSDLPLFSDGDRELTFRYKEDGNDGILKTIQDRNQVTLASSKYVFPDRFKAGKAEFQNRFFSPVMHYNVTQWEGLGSDPEGIPQMICLIPENIANTSRDEAQNTFEPKSIYYKGMDATVGWIFDGEVQIQFPFAFAVNYKAGGENDPILSYSDERIGEADDAVIGKGLLKRFYWQRLAITRNGQHYKTPFKLKNIDVANFLHREHIICRGQKWELVEILGFLPLQGKSTDCYLRKWTPISLADYNATFPKESTVLATAPATDKFDIKYSQRLCLASDIPIIE
jgi:hypothetical protein